MNTYKITFERENGTTGTDQFTAATEAQARKDFGEVYRYGNGHITNVELISSDSATTKEKERKALEKIKKIVEKLGEDSYIGTAFDGCFEIAEENIENDWMCSMKQRVESASDKARKAESKIVEIEKSFQEVRCENEKLRCELKEVCKKSFDYKEMEVFESLLNSALRECEEKIEQQAQIIVNFATSPDAPSFKEAVRKHRAYTETARSYKYHLDNIRSRM